MSSSNKSDYSTAAEKTKTKDATWPDFAAGLYDKLSGKGAQVTYEFDDLSIYIPSRLGKESDHFHWKMDGKIQISSQESDKQEKDDT